jgi:superfamily II DNA or RNA helicase
MLNKKEIDAKIKHFNNSTDVDRNQLQDLVKEFVEHYQKVFLNFATGTSKTLASLLCTNKDFKVLIVIDKRIRESNWKLEMLKWGIDESKYTFTHYRSLEKHKDIEYDTIIADEADIISEANMAVLLQMKINKFIGLSADATKEKLELLDNLKLKKWTVSLSQAIKQCLLPTPIVNIVSIDISKVKEKFNYARFGKVLSLTATECLKAIEEDLDYWKKQCETIGWGSAAKPSYPAINALRTGGKRKKLFEGIKLIQVKKLYEQNKHLRGILFLGSIEVVDTFPNGIHSKKSTAENAELIQKFNDGEINILSSQNVLVRGQNLYGVNYAILGSIDSSTVKVNQMVGRALRTENSVIYIPIVKNTKDETNLNKFLDSLDFKINYIPATY